MAQFRPPSEDVWHQFLSQGMPQITNLVEGAREEKRLEKRQDRSDSLSIINTLIDASSKATTAGDYRASTNFLKNAQGIISNNESFKDLGLDFIIEGAGQSNEYFKTRDEADSKFINAALRGEIDILTARESVSEKGQKELDRIATTGLDKYQRPGFKDKLSVINTLLVALNKVKTRHGRTPKAEAAIIKLLGTELGKLSTQYIYQPKGADWPSKVGDSDQGVEIDIPANFNEYSPEQQVEFFMNYAEENFLKEDLESTTERKDEILRTIFPGDSVEGDGKFKTTGLSIHPTNDPTKIQLELPSGIRSGDIKKSLFDTAMAGGWKSKNAYRTIANAIEGVSKEEIESIFDVHKSTLKIYEKAGIKIPKVRVSKTAQDLLNQEYGEKQ